MTDAFAAMLDDPRWLAWREEERNGRPTKVPYDAHGQGYGSATDPATWGTHAEAERRARGLQNGRSKTGCGIALGDLGGDLYLAGTDLDSSLDENGALARWAGQILDVIESYSETSPSGRGLKGFFLIAAEDVRWFLDRLNIEPDKWGTKRAIPGLSGADHGPGIELYCSHRYFTVTGQTWSADHPRIVRLDRERLEVLAALIPAPGLGNGSAEIRPDRSRAAMSEAVRMQPGSFDEMCDRLRSHPDPDIRAWVREKGEAARGRELRRIWNKIEHDSNDGGRQSPPPPWVYPEDPWEPLHLPSLQGVEVPRRQWIVDQWLPALETTGFSGGGATGKTLAAMQLATAGALGRHCFKIALPEIKAFALLCEDRPGDVHIRQTRINRLYECDFAELGNLMVYPRRSHPRNRLMIFDRDGIGHPTPFFFQLLREVPQFGAELIILDTRADLFLGNQNDEDQARTFVRQICDRLAEETGGAVLLLSHPSRAGKRDGTGESGSVQWDAAFRSRWYLEGKTGDDVEPGARILTRVKSNFAERDETIELKWDDGVLIRTDAPAPSGFAASARQQKADRVSLALLDKLTAQGRPLAYVPQSPHYAPRIFLQQGADREGLNERDFKAAMDRMLGKEIELIAKGPPSRQQFFIARVARRDS